MVTAIILMTCSRQRIAAVGEALADVEEISEVYSVAGKFDLVALARVPRNDDLADLVTVKLKDIEGIEHTETLIAFRAYSRHDLESLFSIGM